MIPTSRNFYNSPHPMNVGMRGSVRLATATWRIAEDVQPEMFTFIESYYNARRLHSHNGYRPPNEVEADWRRQPLAA